MTVRQDIICLVAQKDINDVLCLEALLDSMNNTQYEEQFAGSLDFLTRMQAVVTLATILGFIFLSKVMEQELASADGRFCISSCFLQQLPSYILLCYRLARHELLQLAQVMGREESQTDTLAAITTGTPRLLIITLQTLGNIIMNNITYVRFVNAHTESDGRYNDIYALHQEVVLCFGPLCRLHAGMISASRDVIGAQHLGQLLHTTTTQTIDDAALALVLEHKACDVLIYIFRLWTDFVV